MKKQRSIPQNFSAVIRPKGVDAVVYLYEREGRFVAKAFKGKAINPAFFYGFPSAEHRAAYVAEQCRLWIERAKRDAEYVAERDARSAQEYAALKVGDVLYSSWGYEQTNVEFYQVLAKRGKGSVIVQQIGEICDYNGHDMSGRKMPKIGVFVGEPMLRKYKAGVNIDESIRAWIWDGAPKAYSNYA